jgi:hypothetical protein
MGWPSRGQQFPLDIDRFRLGAQSFNLLHKFHGSPESIDNDFYLRLGVLKGVTSEESLRRIEGEIRESLKSWPPIYILVEMESIAFAGYNEVTLDLDTTQVVSLSFATKQSVEELYP